MTNHICYDKLKGMIKRILYIFLFLFISAQTCSAFWIWTPETKKWTNPKYAAKESPAEQLEFAKSYYEAKDYKTAYKELKKLIKYYHDSLEAPEAQYYLGLCLEEMDKPYEAYLAYQKIIDKYPFSKRIEDAIKREYIVAQKLLDHKYSLAGIEFTGETAAIEIFGKIIENSPYGQYAAASQYKIGLALKARGYYKEAIDGFQKVLDSYPNSEWAEPAKFQIALCTAKASLDPSYDQTLTQEAADKFKDFARQHPDAEISSDAESRIVDLREKEAESNFNIGKFYEKQKSYDSAKIYYNFVIKNYPRSQWALKSLERVQYLERERK